jgi:Tol biopolymer transport system component
MGHFAYPSPDGRYILVVEMARGRWQPCRLVSWDGSVPARQVGPPGAACTAAAWSIDGNWMYLTTDASGVFQISRQPFHGGPVEPITTGPTEAEGIAMAPDGRSFITAIAQRQSALMFHDQRGERQSSTEGFSFDPRFTPDGKRLLYRVLKSGLARDGPSEIRAIDLDSGRDDVVLPDVSVSGLLGLVFDVSADGKLLAASSADHVNGTIWIAPLDRSSPPRRLADAGSRPFFGANGELFFEVVSSDTQYSFVQAARLDGSERRKVMDEAIGLRGISFDRRWLIVRMRGEPTSMVAVPVQGGSRVTLATAEANDYQWKWSADGRGVVVSGPSPLAIAGFTYLVPLRPGQVFPDIPAGGFRSEKEIAALPGARRLDVRDVAGGSGGDTYAFARLSVQRNLYRIPVH